MRLIKITRPRIATFHSHAHKTDSTEEKSLEKVVILSKNSLEKVV